MTDEERPLCDCPEPCGCYAEGYAAGKDKAFSEMEMAPQDDTHAAACGYEPCRVKTACIGALLNMMAIRSPELFEQVEAWVLDGHDD